MYSWLEKGGIVTVFALGMVFGLIILSMLTSHVQAGPFVFRDVSSDGWYRPSVDYLSSIDVVRGYPDGTFQPDRSINRAEMVTLMSRYHQYLLQHYFSQRTGSDEIFLQAIQDEMSSLDMAEPTRIASSSPANRGLRMASVSAPVANEGLSSKANICP